MKQIFIVAISLIIIAAIYSCTDSLGIDSNVQKKLVTGKPDTVFKHDTLIVENSTTITIIKIRDSIKTDTLWRTKWIKFHSIMPAFYEKLRHNNNNETIIDWDPHDLIYNENSAIVDMETMGYPPLLSLDLDIVNPYGNRFDSSRRSRIYSFKIKVSYLPAKGRYDLNGSNGSDYWSSITIKDMYGQSSETRSGSNSPMKLDVDTFMQHGRKTISVTFWCNFKSNGGYIDPALFMGSFFLDCDF